MLRIVVDGPRHPAYNMAMDEALLLLRGEVDYDTLRIYKWSPPGVSLGRGQPADAIDLEEIEKFGGVVVRRPTGGGALLHWEELTYSVVLSKEHPLAKLEVPESAAAIAKGVARAVESLGIEVGVKGGLGSGKDNLCYMRTGSSDVLVRGRKISGSAQLRLGNVLQHGTLLLNFTPAVWIRLIRTPGATPQTLSSKVTSLREVLSEVKEEVVINALVKSFKEVLGEEGRFAEPSKKEVELAHKLMRTKYSREEWNLRGQENDFPQHN